MTEVIRILIVDDHELLTQSLVRLLRDDPSLQVIGTEARAMAGVERAVIDSPDVVLMDYSLPDMDGASATRLLRERLPGQVVVMLTGSDRAGAYTAAMEAGCAAWVRKTMVVHDLIEVIHRVVSGERVRVAEYEDSLPPLDQLVVHYQPIIALFDCAVVGFEALVRWEHPDNGLIAPGHFLALAEESGYVVDIGRHVMGRALQDLAKWETARLSGPPLWMSVNMSAVEFANPNISREVAELVTNAGIDPGSLIIEITETALLEDTQTVVGNMHGLSEAGFKLALDDFGTGFSSISYLRRFPFDGVKIDTSFTKELPHSPRAVLLVESLLQLVRTMGAIGIAEGIERQEQAACLVKAGWEFGQGFLYSRAVPFDQALEIAMTRHSP
jgi:EAL domain-containing protein (putative c-di-GMP-specific phosphodiesterase class I)